MATVFSKKVTGFPGLHVKSRDKVRDAVVAFDKVNSAPTTSGTTYAMLWVDSSGNLTFGYNGSNTIVGAAGSGGQTWESIFSTDKTFAITGEAWALTQGSNVGLMTMNKTASGAGTVLAITNAGTGKDITGNGAYWSIVTSGTAAVLELGSTGTINATDGALTIGKTGTATTFAGTVTFNEAQTNTGSATFGANATLTMTGTADTNVITVTAGDMVMSNGKLAITNDDTDAAITVVANSVTTGNALLITANGVTSGAMIKLVTTDSGFSGSYLIFDDGATVFSVGDSGATVIAGVASGTAALTLTAGDLILTSGVLTMTAGNLTMTDGVLSVTSTGTADVVSVTADSLLANNLAIFKGSGAFTGTTTSSFVAITPTGLTTGTALYIAAAAATTLAHGIDLTMSGTTGTAARMVMTGVLTGVGGILELVADSATTPGAVAGEGIVKLSADGLTTGTALDVTSTSIVLTTGRLADFSHISGNITGTLDKTADLFSVVSTRTVTTGTVADDFDMASLIRTSVINGGGAFTATGAVLYVENAVTNTSGTVTDTVNGVEVVMDSLGTGDGVKVTHGAAAGKAINVVSSGTTAAGVVLVTANSLTSGQVVKIASSATASTSVGRLLLVDHSGATSTSGVLSEFASAANDETHILRVAGSSLLAGGVGLDITLAAMTTGTAIDIGDLDALTSGKGINVVANSADTGAFVLLNLKNDNSSATGASLAFLTQDSTGTSMTIDHNGVTGKALFIDAASTTQTGGVLDISVAALTTGTAIDIGDADGLTTGKILNLVSNSSDTSARSLVFSKNTHASAVGARPFVSDNRALLNSKFTKHYVVTDGTKTCTVWVSQDNTTPNGTLTGEKGDLCLNATGGAPAYCSADGTSWTVLS